MQGIYKTSQILTLEQLVLFSCSRSAVLLHPGRIGLRLTKCLIEERGGFMRFRSRQGDNCGTVMTFFVPNTPRHLTDKAV